jgi:hypothetical protein
MAVSGKLKGGEFERKVAKQLSLWISNSLRDDLLWRSSLSGGRATLQFKQGKKNKSQTGDLSSIDTLSQQFINRFFIEIKFYKDLNIESGFIKATGLLKSFWDKLVKDALVAEKNPMLIARQNHLPTLLLLHHNGARLLNLHESILLCESSKIAEFCQWPVEVYLFDKLLGTKPYALGAKREKLKTSTAIEALERIGQL